VVVDVGVTGIALWMSGRVLWSVARWHQVLCWQSLALRLGWVEVVNHHANHEMHAESDLV
jgi:hypothetical protein